MNYNQRLDNNLLGVTEPAPAMLWFDWSQNDLPCVFARQRAEENRRFLEDMFCSEPDALAHPNTRNGHLQRLWHTAGAGSFLELNWLAEDLRLLKRKPGYQEVLHDLSDIRLSQPTWHVIHTAALFERARPDSVVELINARNAEAPDLIVQIDGDRVPVEAKLLMRSEAEEAFERRAKQLVSSLSLPNSNFPQDALTLIIPKLPPSTTDLAPLMEFCQTNLISYAGIPMQRTSDLCNLFVEPITPARGVSGYHAVWVMTPVPQSEGLRVLQRAKKASRQLRAFPTGKNSGIMAVGLSDVHVGEEIFGHISARIRSGRLSGIAAVLLTKRRTSLSPPIRTTFDLLEVKKNSRASHPIAGPIPLRPLAHAVRMSEAEQHLTGIYAWRYGFAEGIVADSAHAELRLPDLRVLTPAMVA